MRTAPLRGIAYAIGAAFWAAAFLIPYKQAAALAEPQSVAFAMLACAAVLNTVLSLFAGSAGHPGILRASKATWKTGAGLAILATIGNVCSARALSVLEPATVSVLLRSEVVFVGGFAALVLSEKLTLDFAGGAALALAGLWVVRAPGAIDGSELGLLYALGAAACFGAMHVLVRRVAQRVPLVQVNGLRLWLCAVLLAAIPGVVSGALKAPGAFWICAATAAVCGPLISRLLMMFSVRHIHAAQASLVLLLAPLFTLGFGFLFFGTVPKPERLLGGALMLLGIAIPVGRQAIKWSARRAA